MDSDKEILACPRCAGRLRVPKSKRTLKVTCPHCSREFEHPSMWGVSDTTSAAAAVEDLPTQPEQSSLEKPAGSFSRLSAWERWFDRSLRWIVSLTLAVVSYLLLQPYSGETFWVLLSVHAVIATALGVLLIRVLGRGLFLGLDESLRCLSLFLFLVGGLHIGQLGHIIAAPARSALAPAVTQLADYQQSWVGPGNGTVVSSPGRGADWAGDAMSSVSKLASGISNWVGDQIRGWRHSWLDDGGWDATPMSEQAVLNTIKNVRLIPRMRAGRLVAVLTFANTSNVSIEALNAETRIGQADLGVVTYKSADPVVPGQTGEFIASLANVDQTVARWQGSLIVWVSSDLGLRFRSVTMHRFDRKAHFERNLDKWLRD